MARRSYQQTPRGQPYAVEWPEWRLDCASEREGEWCTAQLLIAAAGECLTLRAAQTRLNKRHTENAMDGWTQRNGKWYCPEHAEEKGGAIPPTKEDEHDV